MKSECAGVFVTATDTEVGKTFLCGLLLRLLRGRGVEAGYFKAAASGCRVQNGRPVSEDLAWVEGFSGMHLPAERHCPVCFEAPLAPLTAARLEGREVPLHEIRRAFADLCERFAALVVEGIGGVMVPLKEDYLVLDLMEEMRLPALVVARPALGTINHTLLTLQALQDRGIEVLGFLTSGARDETDAAVITSPEIIARIGGVPCLGHIPFFDPALEDPDDFIARRVPFLQGIGDRITLAKK